jgi:hypothetical protein
MAEGPASGALSHPARSRVEKLDPPSLSADSSPAARRWATRRLSTSAIGTVHEHDRDDRNSARPRGQSPADAATLEPRPLSRAGSNCGWRCPSRDMAGRDVTGQGLRRGQLTPAQLLLSAIARGGALPQPDRLGHLLSLLVTSAGSEKPLRRGAVARFAGVPCTSWPTRPPAGERAL